MSSDTKPPAAMNALTTYIEPLGWALLHFLWQGTAIALLLWLVLRLSRHARPQTRGAAAGAALLLMLGAAAATVWRGASENGTDGTERTKGAAQTCQMTSMKRCCFIRTTLVLN